MKNKEKINEVINPDNTPISGDKPVYDTGEVFSSKTTDELVPMTQPPDNFLLLYGMGYTLLENEGENNSDDHELETPKNNGDWDIKSILKLLNLLGQDQHYFKTPTSGFSNGKYGKMKYKEGTDPNDSSIKGLFLDFDNIEMSALAYKEILQNLNKDYIVKRYSDELPSMLFIINKNLKENVLPNKEYNSFEMLDKDDSIELPNIYKIKNPHIVAKLKTLVSTLNNDDNEIDKVAVIADFIKNIDLSNISTLYKKELLKLIKEKF